MEPYEVAPFALVNNSTHYGSAQTVSVATHFAILSALVALLAVRTTPVPSLKRIDLAGANPISRYIPPAVLETGKPSLGPHSGGGENEPLAARKGLLAPRSSMPLTPPRLLHRDEVDLPVPPAVFDTNAPSNVPLITNLGLPWMPKDTNSAGPGKGHGIGNGRRGGMGDDEGDGAGAGG